MSVKFNIDKRKLEKAMKQQATNALHQRKYDVTCPHCGAKINVPTCISFCPICKNEIDLNLNINF